MLVELVLAELEVTDLAFVQFADDAVGADLADVEEVGPIDEGEDSFYYHRLVVETATIILLHVTRLE